MICITEINSKVGRSKGGNISEAVQALAPSMRAASYTFGEYPAVPTGTQKWPTLTKRDSDDGPHGCLFMPQKVLRQAKRPASVSSRWWGQDPIQMMDMAATLITIGITRLFGKPFQQQHYSTARKGSQNRERPRRRTHVRDWARTVLSAL